MKKFFALLFVCAGLTAMAVNPHVDMSNAKKFDGKPAQNAMVLKSNTLSNQLSAPVMQADKNVMTVQKFFRERNVTPNDNKLMKKAPRRVTEDLILGNKLIFSEQYTLDTLGNVVEDPIFFYGGWNAELEKVEEGVYQTCMYFKSIPFTVNVNLEANTAEMVMDNIGAWQWSDTTKAGNTTTICDTTEYLFIWDEAYILNDAEDAEPANIQGQIYADGSINFPDGWTLYVIDMTTKRVIRNGNTQTSRDTTAGLLCGFMHDTWMMTPTAKHTYVDTYDNSEGENDVYMFQYNADTTLVWNMYGLGNRGNLWIINEDGTAKFPNMQYGGDMASQREYLEGKYAQYDWTNADHVTLIGWDPTGGSDGTGGGDTSSEFIEGNVTPEAITWGNMVWSWWGQNPSTGGWVFLSYPPFDNNALTFTNGDFFMLGVTATPVINSVVNDENVVITAEPGDEVEADVVLGIYDAEAETVTPVDNPYTVERTDEEQVIYFAAIAQAYGKEPSEWAVVEVVIPALEGPSFLRGDVDNDGSVGISDVTALVDYILSKDASEINLDAADVDQDGGIGISDVTALVDYILSKSWD